MMKKVTTLFFGLAFLVLAACQQQKTENTIAEPIDLVGLEQGIREVFELSTELFQNKDVGGLVDRFVADGVLKIPGRPPIVGHEALRANYEGTVALENFELTIEPYLIRISKSGDMAFALAEFAVSFNTPDGPFHEYGISQITFVLVDGRWKMAAENLSPITKPAEGEG